MLLRGWQERVLAAVQSIQIDSAVVLPLLLTGSTDPGPAPRSTPFSAQQQRDCRFDGEMEDDVRDPTMRRPLIPTEDFYVDHHARQHAANLLPGQDSKPEYLLPLTGAQLSRMPHYRLLRPMTDGVPLTEEELRQEAAIWRDAFTEDYRANIAVTQMHEHKDTCFKYVIQKGIRKAKHCRFHFCHFVTLAVHTIVDGVSKVRDIVFARTGKDIVLPRKPGEPPPRANLVDAATGEAVPLQPTAQLGPTVVTDTARGMQGRVQPIRWNPVEGSSNGPGQVLTRGNLDFQCMLRTFTAGFDNALRDELRDPPLTQADLGAMERRIDAVFETELPAAVAAEQAERYAKGLPETVHIKLVRATCSHV